MSDLSTLIEKLSAATEGSRELDFEIALALDGAAAEVCADRPDWQPYPFTTSIDAALTLVPAGWWWEMQQYGGPVGSGRGCYLCRVYTAGAEQDDVKAVNGNGLTAAVACSMAALRAREVAHA